LTLKSDVKKEASHKMQGFSEERGTATILKLPINKGL